MTRAAYYRKNFSGDRSLISLNTEPQKREGRRRREPRRSHTRDGAYRLGVAKLRHSIEAFRPINFVAGDIQGRRVDFGVRTNVDFGLEAVVRAAVLDGRPSRAYSFLKPDPSP